MGRMGTGSGGRRSVELPDDDFREGDRLPIWEEAGGAYPGWANLRWMDGAGDDMKVLTLTQPWASLVAIGAKKIETRSWNTNYRGPLAIHAAKGFPEEAKDHWYKMIFQVELFAGGYTGIDDLPLGMVIATCELVNVVRIDGHHIPRIEPELSFGNYSLGRFMWFLKGIVRLPEPIPARGSLGLWEWDRGEG